MSNQPQIEYSADRGRFANLSRENVEAKIRESRKFWESPAGKARQRELDREAEQRRLNPKRSKFPELAGQKKPALSYLSPADQAIAARSGKL